MKLLAFLLSNALALFLASYYFDTVTIHDGLLGLLSVAIIFSIINFFLKPILKLLLGPFILITFGLLIVVINMGILKITDILLPQVDIMGVSSLFYTTLLISAVNIATHIFLKDKK